MKKKDTIFLLIVITIFCITGCSNESPEERKLRIATEEAEKAEREAEKAKRDYYNTKRDFERYYEKKEAIDNAK